MKHRLKPIYILSLLALCLCACNNSNAPQTGRVSDDSTALELLQTKDSLVFEEIDSVLFQSTLELLDTSQDLLPCITDQGLAELALKDRIRMNKNGLVEALYFSNGKSLSKLNQDYFSFIAYYPTEDILVCEGGHTCDVTFNMRNGAGTEATGNPAYMVRNQEGSYQLTGAFGGQECVSYLIQKNSDTGYVNILDIGWGDENRETPDICLIDAAYWGQEKQLFIYAQIFDNKIQRPRMAYYRLTLIRK